MAEISNTLWQFVVRLYQLPDVERKCLYLQQSKSINVSLLLWVCWCWRKSLPLTLEQLDEAQTVIAKTHQELVIALRTLRQALDHEDASVRYGGAGLHDHISKDVLKPLRQSILCAEIEGEKLVLEQLYGYSLADLSGQDNSPSLALFEYFEALDLSKGDADFFERSIVGAILD